MARPFTPLQAHENQRFLDALARTGNARMAAREVGRPANSFHFRRRRHAAFAQGWDAAVAASHARLHLAGGKRGPEAPSLDGRPRQARPAQDERCLDGQGLTPPPGSARSPSPGNPGEDYRTKGGEPMVVRTRNGKLQIRLAHPDKLTKACEQAFLYALSATANIRLSAAAAGASVAAFYRRRRQNPVFAREMRLALRMGWERLEMAALQASLPQSHSDDRWRQCAPAPMPRFSPDQALQLLFLHEKSVNQSWEQPHRRRRRGESDDTHRTRLQAMWSAEKDLEAEAAALRRAARFEATGDWRHADEPPPPELPPLELVTGWSKASGRPAHHAGVALFGGWRIADLESKLARRRSG